jgi:WD40 repeat protein
VGERVDVTDVFLWPIAGVADGLVVNPIDEETYGRFAYWSPTDGLAPLSLRDPEEESVVAASGDLLVVVSSDRVSIVDIANGDYLNSFTFDFGERVSSACLSPDQRHIFVVGSNGRAYLGNTISGELFGDYPPIQAVHGVGWTSDDQLVYLAVSEMGRSLVVQDLSPFGSDRHEIALLSGTKKWWLAASGTMC